MFEESVFILGDIHGDHKPIRDLQLRLNTSVKGFYDQTNYLICLGDFGANYFFDGQRDEAFKTKISRYHFQYFVIRGNHEERPSVCIQKYPNKWHTEIHFGNAVYVENDYPNIWYALDKPAVYNIKGYTTLILGGAYSVDKFYRLQNQWSWFSGEQMTEDEMNYARHFIEKQSDYDLVLSHTCPICYEPTDLFLSVVDQSMVDKTMERFLGEIEYKVNYKRWCWGHYHNYREYPIGSDNRRRVMLFNDAAIGLHDLMETSIKKGLTKL